MANKFKTLGQRTYKDENGNEISADKVEFIAPYQHVADGFYNWECGQCGNTDNSRSCGWSISGQVLKCRKCGYYNLLVKTNTDELNQWMGKNLTLEQLTAEITKKQAESAQYVPRAEVDALIKGLTEFNKAQQTFSIVLNNNRQHIQYAEEQKKHLTNQTT